MNAKYVRKIFIFWLSEWWKNITKVSNQEISSTKIHFSAILLPSSQPLSARMSGAVYDERPIYSAETLLNFERLINKEQVSAESFFFQNKYLINFFSCVYLSSHTVSRYPLIFSSGLGTGNVLGTVQTAIDAAKNFFGREQDRLDGRL
ncbi:hypothetical protein BpHYR1_033269 [Brachionus plicatilis]|uniref:Uncharacterized protein n=1 Tax=Brachionus plicatilis TaxID=10195 RepID=A0A3M7PPC4_BRAPC|nr:hypothetical protein BpHYR1_033269 [Brachionus plicatilis]